MGAFEIAERTIVERELHQPSRLNRSLAC
jgi:hypothetical protein